MFINTIALFLEKNNLNIREVVTKDKYIYKYIYKNTYIIKKNNCLGKNMLLSLQKKIVRRIN